ncbi:hypothetical protein DEU56DRAFT_492455 [Suillus clintonianus]|uniref:uncharacterized protein n=1 Tax=Suillus clintonianus TaxID=1904413 RepID=UPI001B85F898|nr:uncharacterized protein DEU56DRAFT_492455 [Suillus clintonianus]KAG2129800.1 hypothetical protein DEU56DRAFT_492455 [Suillus clintonianus]
MGFSISVALLKFVLVSLHLHNAPRFLSCGSRDLLHLYLLWSTTGISCHIFKPLLKLTRSRHDINIPICHWFATHVGLLPQLKFFERGIGIISFLDQSSLMVVTAL